MANPYLGNAILEKLEAELKALQSAGAGSKRGAGDSSQDPNLKYNGGVFRKFKERKTDKGKEWPAAVVREMKKEHQLPKSKYWNGDMCLAYHVKGMCNSGCPCAEDHKVYTEEEYKATNGLADWCEKHYPASA